MVTWTVGGVICGYWATGSPMIATAPISMVMIAMTLAKIGRSMKKREIMGRSLILRLDSHFRSRPRHLQSLDNVLLAGLARPE